jgi:hypothetical protein
MGNEKENDFKVIIKEIYSSIWVDFKITEVVKKVLIIYSAKARKRICTIYNI